MSRPVPRGVYAFDNLGNAPYLASLVLGDLVLGVLLAVSTLAVGAASLGNVDLHNPLPSASAFLLCIYAILFFMFRGIEGPGDHMCRVLVLRPGWIDVFVGPLYRFANFVAMEKSTMLIFASRLMCR